jgi:aspartyl-tRNA(Asn)/glutamyl-tRNA(Gln) amidotransferase subunit C
MVKNVVTTSDIDKLAKLSALPITDEQKSSLTNQVGITVEYVSKLQELPTKDMRETSQVTGVENVYRDDVVDSSRILSQVEALSNAKKTYNGLFVVDAVFKE